MTVYKAPVEEVQFLLNDVFHIERYANLPGFSDASPDVIAAILGEAAKFSEEVLVPLNRVGDIEGCKRHAGRARYDADRLQGSLQATVRRRLDRHFHAGGIWRPGPAGDDDVDRQRISRVVEPRVLDVSGSDSGRDRRDCSCTAPTSRRKNIVPKMASGEWAGTMNLTEPHCGTDLGLLRTKAVKQARRQLQDHRHEDFHFRRRAGSHRPTSSISCWRASKARPPARAASRCSSCRK